MLRDSSPQHWKLLGFYYNPDNPRLFVPKRTGFRFTLNFGRRAAWVIAAIILGLILFAAIANNRVV